MFNKAIIASVFRYPIPKPIVFLISSIKLRSTDNGPFGGIRTIAAGVKETDSFILSWYPAFKLA